MSDETMGVSDDAPNASRREALRTLAVGAASIPLTGTLARRALPIADETNNAASDGTEIAANAPRTGPRGTASDPDLLHPKRDWPRKLGTGELATLTVLCDTIIPADAKGPSASAVGTPAFINEYVSHATQERGLVQLRGGLAWLDAESRRRFGRGFVALAEGERRGLCDDICYLPTARPEFKAAARFFDFVRDLSASWYYSSDAGMKDLGYIGNVALPAFAGPPPNVLKHLGLE